MWEPTEATTRFERFDQDLLILNSVIQERDAELTASAVGGRVQVRIGKVSGFFPTFEIGLCTVGDLFKDGQEDAKVEDVPGSCPGATDIDRFLLAGGQVSIKRLGTTFLAVLTRSLPNRVFKDRGEEHQVYRKEVRKARGEDYLGALGNALGAAPEVIEGSVMTPR